MLGLAVWGQLDVQAGEADERVIGGVVLRTRRLADEWHVAISYTEGSGPETGASEPDWTRFITQSGGRIRLQPALPDRPVVVRPRSPIMILPDQSGRFFFSVPLWVRFVSQGGRDSATMSEVPTQQLSSTWFGAMETGQLCYSVDSRLLPTLPATDADDAYARCEIEISNSSREPLKFERLCVHVEHMHLYLGEEKFWSNRVRVVFKGADQISQLTYRKGPPEMVEGAQSVCEPREPLERNIFKRSFNLIREITGI